MGKSINTQIRLTDAVKRFCNENPDMLYSDEEERWFKYNGSLWEDATDEFEHIILQIWEKENLLYDVHLKNLRKLCKVKQKMKNHINFESEMLLNTPEGVLDFKKFHELCQSGLNQKEHIHEWVHPHTEYKESYLTNITGASYSLNSLPPEKFLNFVNDLFQGVEELTDYFMKYFAYCLTGLISQQYFHILYGIGRNGKSTLLLIMEAILGTYFGIIGNDVVMLNKNSNVWRTLYRNRHKTLLIFNELSEDFILNLPMIKMLTGDDLIPVNINRQDKKFKGNFKILLNTNHIPEVGSIENRGVWDRIRLLITQPPIPENQRIDEFYKILVDEKDQILSYLIDNFLDEVLENGLRKMPAIMVLAKAYKEFAENPVEFFFDHTCKLSNNPLNKAQHLKARYLYGQYYQFHLFTSKAFERLLKIREETGSRKVLVPPVSEKRFSMQMDRLGAYKEKASEMYYKNIYFSSERIYSEFGERVESEDMENFKTAYIDKYENAYVQKRRLDEAISPSVQAKAMAQMPNETENYFEKPVPAGTVNCDDAAFNRYALLVLCSQKN